MAVDHPTGQLELRRMAAQDIPAVVEIENRSFPAPWPETLFASELHANSSRSYALVLECTTAEPLVVGYMIAWYVAREIHLLSIAVHPDHRRCGYARRMIASLIALGRQLGGREIYLEVRVSNHAARSLYRQIGFRVTGRRKRYYSDNDEDAVVMRLRPLPDPSQSGDPVLIRL